MGQRRLRHVLSTAFVCLTNWRISSAALTQNSSASGAESRTSWVDEIWTRWRRETLSVSSLFLYGDKRGARRCVRKHPTRSDLANLRLTSVTHADARTLSPEGGSRESSRWTDDQKQFQSAPSCPAQLVYPSVTVSMVSFTLFLSWLTFTVTHLLGERARGHRSSLTCFFSACWVFL